MLKSAAAKLAHNSTIPALAGNKALRPLQDLITAEKAIITSLSRLSVHFSQASEALRTWAHGEGDDLSDTLSASTKLLLEFSSSLKQFASHEKTIREHMKSIRTQEERLDQLKHRRKGVASKADAAERKLNRMEIGHKDTATQTTLLEGLRNSMRELDSDIMTGEAKLGDLKRTSTNVWMTLKFGGLEECCRKGIIVADAGKLIMAELPQLVTEPGLARPFYTGNGRTEAYVTEALHALGNVSNDAPNSSGPLQPLYVSYQDGPISAIPSDFPDNESIVSMGQGGLPGDDDTMQYRGQYGYGAPRPSLGEKNDYDRVPAASQADEHGTFLPPPDAARARSLRRKPPPRPSSSSKPPLRDDLPSSSQGPGRYASPGGRFATFPVKGRRQDSVGQMIAGPLDGPRPSDVEQMSQIGYLDDVAPQYIATPGPPPGPPPGAAPPAMVHASLYPGSYDSGPSFDPDNTAEDEDDTQLPYVMSPRERKAPFGSRPLPVPVPRPWLPPGREAESSEEHHGRTPISTELDPFPDPVTPSASTQELNAAPTSPEAVEDPDDEQALNAAAAREVSRELDLLMYHPPTRELPPPPLTPPTPNTPPAISPRSSSDSVIPPSSPFARARSPVSGSPPVPRRSSERPSPVNVPPSPPGASLSSSPVQHAQLPRPSIVLTQSSSPSLSSINNTSFRTPPELPPSPNPAISQRSLPQSQGVSFSPGKPPVPPRRGSGMISVAAFRRPPPAPPRTGTEPPVSPRDVTPLSVKKRGSPNAPRMGGTSSSTSSVPGALPSQLSPSLPQEQHQDDEFDYISAYYSAGGGEETGSPPSYTESRARSGSLR